MTPQKNDAGGQAVSPARPITTDYSAEDKLAQSTCAMILDSYGLNVMFFTVDTPDQSGNAGQDLGPGGIWPLFWRSYTFFVFGVLSTDAAKSLQGGSYSIDSPSLDRMATRLGDAAEQIVSGLAYSAAIAAAKNAGQPFDPTTVQIPPKRVIPPAPRPYVRKAPEVGAQFAAHLFAAVNSELTIPPTGFYLVSFPNSLMRSRDYAVSDLPPDQGTTFFADHGYFGVKYETPVTAVG